MSFTAGISLGSLSFETGSVAANSIGVLITAAMLVIVPVAIIVSLFIHIRKPVPVSPESIGVIGSN